MPGHADRRSVSSRQLSQQQWPSDHTCWDCVTAQSGDDVWWNEDVVDWPLWRLECSSPSSTEELYNGGNYAPSPGVCNSLAAGRRANEGEEGKVSSSRRPLLAVPEHVSRHSGVIQAFDWKWNLIHGENTTFHGAFWNFLAEFTQSLSNEPYLSVISV